MHTWGAPILTGYSCEDLPCRATRSRLLLTNRPACQTLSKALDISCTTAWVAQDLLKALATPSDTTVRRSPVDQEELKPY